MTRGQILAERIMPASFRYCRPSSAAVEQDKDTLRTELEEEVIAGEASLDDNAKRRALSGDLKLEIQVRTPVEHR